MIGYCSGSRCISPYQDKQHGKGRRVMNEILNKSGGKSYKCTVCLAMNDESRIGRK